MLRQAFIILFVRNYLVTGNTSQLFPSNLNKCFTGTPFLKSRFGSVQQCILECQLRPKCRGVNFYRRISFCELTNDVTTLTLSNSQQPCMSLRKTEMPEIPSCPVCAEPEVCDLSSTTCTIKECPSVQPVQNGSILGNVQIDKAVSKLVCDLNYQPEPADGRLVCQDGDWSHPGPSCVSTAGCPEPPDELYATLDPGTTSTSVGTVRMYWCWGTHITPSGSPSITITCQTGGMWTTPTESCVRDCSNPTTITNGNVASGTTHEGSIRQYTCDTGYVVQLNGAVTQDQTANATCQSDGLWSNSGQIACTAVDCSSNDLVSGLPNAQITASSEYDTDHSAFYGRLDNTQAWRSAYDDDMQYIQFDFGSPRNVTGITTQGFDHKWAKDYLIKHSDDCITFHELTDTSGETVFLANLDYNSHVTNMFPAPVSARCIQVNPQNWESSIAMRIALLGC